MNLLGIGVLFARGRGIAAFDRALREGWVPPETREGQPAYAVPAEALSDKTVLAKLRRADRFSQMAVLAAWDALQDSGVRIEDASRVAIILATAFGPHVTTFKFLDDILNFGDAGTSPTTFSHSVHNAAASYVALALGLRGSALTLSQFSFPFHEALRLADCWLAEDRCDHALVGALDEIGSVFQHVCSRKLATAEDGRIQPFACARNPAVVPGEGSAFFLLTRREAANAYGSIEVADDAVGGDLRIADTGGLSGDESAWRAELTAGATVASYAPVFGSLKIGSAFHGAAAALMLRNHFAYACPVRNNPHGFPLCLAAGPMPLREIVCAARDCRGARSAIRLKKA
jgi:3-oxoacyl-[acyl-carrier-protein] synthase II